ncbi:hypothetical protein B0O80DRAFT_503958 [Mortierella sp. GBAus27b]|nr:hypothetical protein B0O80DRAFT_503958 [Mortierella sp. GBAus27b]
MDRSLFILVNFKDAKAKDEHENLNQLSIVQATRTEVLGKPSSTSHLGPSMSRQATGKGKQRATESSSLTSSSLASSFSSSDDPIIPIFAGPIARPIFCVLTSSRETMRAPDPTPSHWSLEAAEVFLEFLEKVDPRVKVLPSLRFLLRIPSCQMQNEYLRGW